MNSTVQKAIVTHAAYFLSKSGGKFSFTDLLFSASPFISFKFLILIFFNDKILLTLTIFSRSFNGYPFIVPPTLFPIEAFEIKGSLVLSLGEFNFIEYVDEGAYCACRGLNLCVKDDTLIVSGGSFDWKTIKKINFFYKSSRYMLNN